MMESQLFFPYAVVMPCSPPQCSKLFKSEIQPKSTQATRHYEAKRVVVVRSGLEIGSSQADTLERGDSTGLEGLALLVELHPM